MSDNSQAYFSGWAILELMGHNREVGYVTTDYFGPVGLFRVDRPELPEREYELQKPQYVDGRWTPAGARVKRAALPAKSVLVGPSSIFRITPCTELLAMEAIEQMLSPPLILLSLPERAQIEAAVH